MSDSCALCDSLEDYESKLLNHKNWGSHDHKCVVCGWTIEDLTDGHQIKYAQVVKDALMIQHGPLTKSMKDRYLNGYWTHNTCSKITRWTHGSSEKTAIPVSSQL